MQEQVQAAFRKARDEDAGGLWINMPCLQAELLPAGGGGARVVAAATAAADLALP